MVCIFNNISIRNTCTFLVLITLPVAGIALPLPTRQINNIENQLNDDSSLIVNRILDNLLKLEKKGKINEMIDFMLDVKGEVESHLGYSISPNDQLKEVQKLAKEEGIEIPKKQIENFKKILKKREKKRNKTTWGVGFRSKKNQDNEEKKEKEEIELPVRMAFGITITLCGIFTWLLPHPAAKAAGFALIIRGSEYITDAFIDKAQEDQDERKKKTRENKVLKKYEDELEKYEESNFDWRYWNTALQRRI